MLFLVTGGSNGISQTSTFYIDLSSKTFTQGPSLIQARSRHGCTALDLNGRRLVLVAGGWNPSLDTTEYLDLSQDDPVWVSGPQLPAEMDDFVLTESSVGVLLIGGFDATHIQFSKTIFRLTCTFSCDWQELEQTLAVKQSSPIVIPIPESLDLCQNAITTTQQPIESTSMVTMTPTSASVFQDDCSYCPECARVESEFVGGQATFAEIEKVTKKLTLFLI